MNRTVDDFEFSVERNLARPLSLQLVDGLRAAIKGRRVADGDVLPSISEWANRLQCSTRVAREAYARLRAEGLVVQRPRCGTRVCLEGAKVWNGHVMIVVVGEMVGFYRVQMVETVASRLESHGVRVTRAVVPRIDARRCDLVRLRSYLDEKPDLVILQTHVESVVREVAARVPHISLSAMASARRSRRWVGAIDQAIDSAYAEFACRLAKAGVRHVAVADFQRFPHEVYQLLENAGIKPTRWLFPPEVQRNVASIRQAAFEGMRELMSKPGFAFPQVIYIADDHVAQGALMAFSEMGVKIPGDVSVVSFCNAGDIPISPVELARIETDPTGVGMRAAEAALEYLKTKRRVGTPAVPARFVPGASLAY